MPDASKSFFNNNWRHHDVTVAVKDSFVLVNFLIWYGVIIIFMEEGTVTIHKTRICHFELIECVPNKLGNCINYPICILRFNFTGVQS